MIVALVAMASVPWISGAARKVISFVFETVLVAVSGTVAKGAISHHLAQSLRSTMPRRRVTLIVLPLIISGRTISMVIIVSLLLRVMIRWVLFVSVTNVIGRRVGNPHRPYRQVLLATAGRWFRCRHESKLLCGYKQTNQLVNAKTKKVDVPGTSSFATSSPITP